MNLDKTAHNRRGQLTRSRAHIDRQHRHPSASTSPAWPIGGSVIDRAPSVPLLLIALMIALAIVVGVSPALSMASLYALHHVIPGRHVRRAQLTWQNERIPAGVHHWPGPSRSLSG